MAATQLKTSEASDATQTGLNLPSIPDDPQAFRPEQNLAQRSQGEADAADSEDSETAVSTAGNHKAWVPVSAGFDSPMPGQWQQSVADALNFLQLGWKATAYNIFQGKTPRELNHFA